MDEMHHAEWLIEQILFFERALKVSRLNQMKISKTVSEMIGNDDNVERHAIHAYNNSIRLTRVVDDQGTLIY